ncbi:FG-GAP-like repeat-containing protein [Pelagicoccus sp. SDUM812002]|uniref:FG-GAP-like repeat-containing protein n=1 Tax=Pelagicoccus sp. SDUM812002 TaxID=3041266 RepID=UPI002811170F|nr:FG-GAP-like repeat-containing protein [Pelagicoccus sp. SDUM812002]
MASSLQANEPSIVPFSERSVQGDETMFTELSPELTGIVTSNRYDDPRMWGSLHSEYNVGAIGTGVAIGDYDNDGKPDLFVVSKVESGRLFRNLGGWKFEDVTVAAGLEDNSGIWKQGVSFVDVDNDGLLDLYICRFDAPNLLYMNLGDGSFREEAERRGLAVVDSSGMGCFADFDRDGWLDVYIQTNILDSVANIEGQRDYLFRNRGDGTFEDVTNAAGILKRRTQGHSATWWDQNHDGWPDLYVANDFAPADILYRNNGDGTFYNAIDEALPHTPFSSMGADLGDIDNDGDVDFFVTDMAGVTHEFSQRGLVDTRGMLPDSENLKLNTAIQVHSNALYLNTRTERSMEVAHLAGLEGTNWTWSTRFEDLDSDGRLDLFVTNGMDREHNNLDFIVKKLKATNVMQRIQITKMSPVLSQTNLAYVNRGDLVFEEVGEKWGLDKFGVSFGSAFGDLDGDGDLDLVFSNYKEGATVLRNDNEQGNNIVIALRGVDSNRYGIGARIEATTAKGTQARQLVLARGYLSTSEPVAHFGLGAEAEVEELRIFWPSGGVQSVRNLKAGYRYTIEEVSGVIAGEEVDALVANPLFEQVGNRLGLEVKKTEEVLEGTVTQPLLYRGFNRRGPGLAVGDLNGNGRDEIVFAATAKDGAKVLVAKEEVYEDLNTGELSMPPPINGGAPLIFDANGDGLNDLLLTAGGAALMGEEPEYQPTLWINDGKGFFSRAAKGMLPEVPISVGAAVAADFDRNGTLDVFLGGRLYPGFYPEPAISALLSRKGNRFENIIDDMNPDLAEIGLVTSALASDVDNDGWIDLILTLEWGGVLAFRNIEGEIFENVSDKWGFDSAGLGLWTSVASGDFNKDGRLDYVLGNQGLNTIFSASREFPMHLYSGDFAGSGNPQLILSYNVEGEILPVFGRTEIAAKIPQVLKSFPSNDVYAASTVEEIFGANEIEKAQLYSANELRSGVLMSQKAGGFSFIPLPRLAQAFPAQGIAVADFNGDGSQDLALVGNDYSANPTLGRFDGGLGYILLGDGCGDFEPLSLLKSGFSVPGNVKALVVADFDGDARPDLLASRNNQESLAFLNRSDGTRAVALQLRGKEGNPNGVGSRIELVSESRIVQVWEVSAGGGYASQSSATVFLTIPDEASHDAELRIRWPNGVSARLEVPPAGGYIFVSEEGAL